MRIKKILVSYFLSSWRVYIYIWNISRYISTNQNGYNFDVDIKENQWFSLVHFDQKYFNFWASRLWSIDAWMVLCCRFSIFMLLGCRLSMLRLLAWRFIMGEWCGSPGGRSRHVDIPLPSTFSGLRPFLYLRTFLFFDHVHRPFYLDLRTATSLLGLSYFDRCTSTFCKI